MAMLPVAVTVTAEPSGIAAPELGPESPVVVPLEVPLMAPLT